MPNKPGKTSKQEAIRFGDELRNKLKAEAEREGRSFSGMVRRICELYFAGGEEPRMMCPATHTASVKSSKSAP